MRPFYWLGTGIAALVSASFVVSNRESVEIGLWPLPDLYGLPLYLVVGAALALGFLAGSSVTWLRHGRVRADRRRHARRVVALEAELAAGRPAAVPATVAGPGKTA
jgi:uncharacterized integral membrane protein